MKGKAHIDS